MCSFHDKSLVIITPSSFALLTASSWLPFTRIGWNSDYFLVKEILTSLHFSLFSWTLLFKDHWDTLSAICCALHCQGMKKVAFQVHFCRVRINFSFSIWIHLRWLTPEGWDEIACPLAKLLLKPASPEKLCRLTNPLFRLHVFYIGKCYLIFGQWFVIILTSMLAPWVVPLASSNQTALLSCPDLQRWTK